MVKEGGVSASRHGEATWLSELVQSEIRKKYPQLIDVDWRQQLVLNFRNYYVVVGALVIFGIFVTTK